MSEGLQWYYSIRSSAGIPTLACYNNYFVELFSDKSYAALPSSLVYCLDLYFIFSFVQFFCYSIQLHMTCDYSNTVTAVLEYLKSGSSLLRQITIPYFHCAIIQPINKRSGHHVRVNRLLRGMAA